MDDVIKQMPPFPSICALKSDSNSYQFFVITEKEVISGSCSLCESLIDVLAAYFAFDMAYPPLLNPLLLTLYSELEGFTERT